MSREQRRLSAAIFLLMLPLLTAGLRPGASPPSVERARNAGEVYVAMENFLAWTDQARPEEMDQRARTFNAVQIPLAAAAIDQAERKLDTHDEMAYRALVRWQFWLSKRLDPENRGAWEANRGALTTPGSLTRATTAVLPALEMIQLESLAGMALRRDHVFDALVWWRDRDLLERKIARNLFDSATGGYAQYDSLGHRKQHSENLADLLPVGLNAPTDRGAARRLALDLLAGGRVDSPQDERARAWMSQALNPVSGWPRQPGLDLLSENQDAILLSRAIALLQEPELNTMADEVFRELGLPTKGPLHLDLGSGDIAVPGPTPSIHKLERSRVAVEFLQRGHVLRAEEAADALLALDEAAELLPSRRDQTASMLKEWADRWAELDPKNQQENLFSTQDLPPVNGEESSSAFGYRDKAIAEWMPAALDLLRRDAAGLFHQSQPEARYTALIEPGVVARDHSPRVHIHYLRRSSAEKGLQGGWTAFWTDGLKTSQPATLRPRPQSDLDAFADLPPLPSEKGLWWLVLRGPLGAPDHAPACALVDPMRATVQTLPFGDDHSRYFEISVENALISDLQGRYEIVTPTNWRVDPEPAMNFLVDARGTESWKVKITAPRDEPPGLYSVQWRFYDGTQMISVLDDQIAVHFRWLGIGPFPGGRSTALAGQHGPERKIRLGESYEGLGGTVRWHHLAQSALSSNGWVEIGRSEPGAVWYALTAVSTTTHTAEARLESPTPALLKLNGSEIERIQGRRRSFDTPLTFGSGPNYLLVKIVADDEGIARMRLDLKNDNGAPLRTADYRIEHLLDGYAYVGDAPDAKNAPSSPEGQARQEMRLVAVSYHDPSAKSVSVVGNFNGWSPQANPLQRGDDGTWRTEIRLHPGQFQYKLVVNGNRWIADPENPGRVADGFGAVNSVLVVR